MSISDRPASLLHATFVLTGIVTTLLGPTLPVLASWWALDDAQAGLLFAAQFAGSMLGSVLSSVGMTRAGFRRTLVSGVVLMAAGVSALAAGNPVAGVAAIFSYGVGLGLTIPATNLFIAQTHPDTRSAALSLLNLSWGIGAVGAPPVVALFDRLDRVGVFLIGVAAALLAMGALLTRLSEPRAEAASGDAASAAPARGTGRPVAFGFGVLLFLYVGTETAVAGWVAVYARRLDLMSETLALAMPALFWAALLAGRAAAPLVLRRWPDAAVLVTNLLLATVGVAALAASRSGALLAFAIVVAGLGLSTVFPIAMALFTRELGRDAARGAGALFVLAGFGGAVLPPLVGVVSTATGNLAAGLIVPLGGCIAMLGLRAWHGRGALAGTPPPT